MQSKPAGPVADPTCDATGEKSDTFSGDQQKNVSGPFNLEFVEQLEAVLEEFRSVEEVLAINGNES